MAQFSRASNLRAACLLLFLAFPTPFLHAQGCPQCRDNTAATPPQTQAAYRHAIVLLAGVATILFGGTLLLLKRNR
jgi:hypothetical protein